VGFTPDRDYQYLEVNQFLRRLHPEIVGQTERMITEVGGAVVRDPATDLLTVNREFTVSLVLSRCNVLDDGRRRWNTRASRKVSAKRPLLAVSGAAAQPCSWFTTARVTHAISDGPASVIGRPACRVADCTSSAPVSR
jgi:hypothetical protein